MQHRTFFVVSNVTNKSVEVKYGVITIRKFDFWTENYSILMRPDCLCHLAHGVNKNIIDKGNLPISSDIYVNFSHASKTGRLEFQHLHHKSKRYAKISETEAIRTQIQPSKPKREITKITHK